MLLYMAKYNIKQQILLTPCEAFILIWGGDNKIWASNNCYSFSSAYNEDILTLFSAFIIKEHIEPHFNTLSI